MAYLDDDNKQKQNDPNAPAQNANSASGGIPGSTMLSNNTTSNTPVSSMGAGSNTASGPVTKGPTATASPEGGGGTGWTNLQSYLTANQGGNSASDTLSKGVGSQFTQDQNTIDSQAKGVQDAAKRAGQSNYMAPDQASTLLSDASKNYTASNPNSTYTNDVTQFQNDLNGQYSGPQVSDYNPSVSALSQQYGQALGNQDQLNSVMSGLYANKAGQSLGQGQMNLQGLLQNNDPNFQNTVHSLQNQYGNLNQDLQTQVGNVGQAVQNAQGQYSKNQQDLYNYLTGQQTSDKTAIDNKVNDVNGWLNNVGSTFNNYLGNGSNSKVTGSLSGPSANESNVAGVGNQRNEWDTIANILQSGAAIPTSDPLNLNNVNWNYTDTTPYGSQPGSVNLGQYLNTDASQGLANANNSQNVTGIGYQSYTQADPFSSLYGQAQNLGLYPVNPFTGARGPQKLPSLGGV